MKLLAACDLDLAVPLPYGTTPGEVEINLFDLQSAMMDFRGAAIEIDTAFEETMDAGDYETSLDNLTSCADLVEMLLYITPEDSPLGET